MTGGILAYVFEAQNVIRETGVTFDEAMEIVKVAHEPKPEPESNVVYGVDFLNKKPKGETIGAL
jgi:hypothetical protein